MFISFRHENIYKILSINKNTKVGLSFCPPTSLKKIIEKSKNRKINFLILDKFYLNNKKIPHQILNAKHHEKEAEIIANAGKPGMVTIATNMAGRGTDIVLGGKKKTKAI